jgi:hypothetical protein
MYKCSQGRYSLKWHYFANLFQISDVAVREGSAMKLRMTALIAAWAALCGSPAGATLVPITASFFTAPADGILTFTYEGYSASDTDHMAFTFNDDALFTNKVSEVDAVVHQIVVGGQTYQISLHDSSTGNTWFSAPASNQDRRAHLASTSIFSDFHLGATAPAPLSTNCALLSGCYLGWEDRSQPGADKDFNDLVFALQFTPDNTQRVSADPALVSEPVTVTLLCTGLLVLGFIAPRRP